MITKNWTRLKQVSTLVKSLKENKNAALMFKSEFTFQRCGLNISDSGEVTESQNFRPGTDFRTPRDGEGQGSPACCSPWGHRESDAPEQLNNNEPQAK